MSKHNLLDDKMLTMVDQRENNMRELIIEVGKKKKDTQVVEG